MNVLLWQLGPRKKGVYKILNQCAKLIIVHVSHSKIWNNYIDRMHLNTFYKCESMDKINLEYFLNFFQEKKYH